MKVKPSVDLTVLESLDFEVPCDSRYHEAHVMYHFGPAAYLFTTPCVSGFRCAAFVSAVRTSGGASCDICQRPHLISEITIIPIGVAS